LKNKNSRGFFIEKHQEQDGLLDLKKFFLGDIKKTEKAKQCQSKDFQPFLEYSVWHFFWPIVEELIKGCRDSLNFLGHSIGKLQVLNEEKILEHLIIQDLSKSIAKLNATKKCQKRKLQVKTLKEDDNPLHELFARKRKYSKFIKS